MDFDAQKVPETLDSKTAFMEIERLADETLDVSKLRGNYSANHVTLGHERHAADDQRRELLLWSIGAVLQPELL